MIGMLLVGARKKFKAERRTIGPPKPEKPRTVPAIKVVGMMTHQNTDEDSASIN
jgi:hypothetical protein